MTFAARGSGIAFLGGLAWLLATALPRAARGEVRDAAERLAKAWRERGASVVVEEPRFLNDDQTMAVILPELPDGVCTTVVLLGARGLGFHVSAGDGRNDAIGHVPSEAGVLSIERCHDPVGRRLLVTSESGRGSLEVIVARSETPLPAVQLVLPERSGGGLGPMPDPGLLAPLPPPEKRADLVELRARRDGATAEPRSTWQAAADGSGG
ncbi:MAG: hypothetical protein FWD17_00845, partial [Polyangiaceae bacterium]|nr:hypothetical protein [Polyangiaceae bacterium]